jgi:hypothetical protein
MTTYCAFFIILSSMVFAGCSSMKVQSGDASQPTEGMPFGKLTDADTDHLKQFAQEKGFDLGAELQKAYAKDTNALARVLVFSLNFNSLDQNARTYGQMIYSSFLNLGESIGPDQYSAVLAAQSSEVQQRVRDFLYFAVTRVPRNERAQVGKEIREDFPKLFPKDYHFGHDDQPFRN